MRGYAAILVLILALAAGAPANAGELFKHGAVTCAATSPDVTALNVSKCSWKKAPGGGLYTGTCNGSVAIKGEDIAFSVSGQAKRIDYVYPDNDTPLTFDYRGLTCKVVTPRVKTVQNCHPTKRGIGKECQVCAITAAKVCFNVRLDVAIKTVAAAEISPAPATKAAAGVSTETVGAIAGE